MVFSCENSGCKIGIMGGTFDPIHLGHLVLAEEIRYQFGLDKIIFVPVGTPPHKGQDNISDKMLRYDMTRLACMTNPHFEVSKIEIESEAISYTINTIKKIKALVHSEHVEMFFITGADAIMSIESWKDYEELLSLCSFIGATRPGIHVEHLEEKIEHLKAHYGAKIYLTHIPGLAISSTDIRNRIREGRSIKYLLPESVEQFILDNHLYL
ncbi:MAG: nicotinate-nucleotide adenylyltransferase [Clostridia bacterium]|nr:nicotinate-nucleotide adenylyltransferase [Clostridia bacterium]